VSIFDSFKGKQYKSELEELREQYNNLKNSLTPEMQNVFDLNNKIATLNNQVASLQSDVAELSGIINKKHSQIEALNRTIQSKERELTSISDDILVESFGLYRPTFAFNNALDYKEKLAEIRDRQKFLIKENRAVTGVIGWTVNNDKRKGQKMVADTQKLLLRAFNLECDDLVAKVKYNNIEASIDRIYKSAGNISKLGSIMQIQITNEYVNAKVKELRLAFEYAQAKQEEKEALKAAREEAREQAKIQKQLEEERKKVEKEQTHYQTAYEKLEDQLKEDPNNKDLQEKLRQLKEHLQDVEKALNDIDYRQANMKAGYVYVISNIGAFGKDVYKIGMTRRLDPQERVDELGSASVPFNFDVHAMIFSDDAPALEAALHRAFANKKLNMVNQRREFFRVSLEEIKAVVKANFDKTVEFIDVPDAEQYRVSEKMRQSIN